MLSDVSVSSRSHDGFELVIKEDTFEPRTIDDYKSMILSFAHSYEGTHTAQIALVLLLLPGIEDVLSLCLSLERLTKTAFDLTWENAASDYSVGLLGSTLYQTFQRYIQEIKTQMQWVPELQTSFEYVQDALNGYPETVFFGKIEAGGKRIKIIRIEDEASSTDTIEHCSADDFIQAAEEQLRNI